MFKPWIVSLGFVVFAIFALRTSNLSAQLSLDAIDVDSRNAIELNESLNQRLTQFRCEIEAQFFQQDAAKQVTSGTSFFWKNPNVLRSKRHVDYGTGLAEKNRFKTTELLRVSDEPLQKYLSYPSKSADFSQLSPCKHFGIRGTIGPFNDRSEFTEMGRLLWRIPGSRPSMTLLELIQTSVKKVEFLGYEKIGGSRCARLAIFRLPADESSKLTSEGLNRFELWIDLDRGGCLRRMVDYSHIEAREFKEIGDGYFLPSLVVFTYSHGTEKAFETQIVKLRSFETDLGEVRDDPELGFRFPKYCMVLKTEREVADGTPDPTQEFLIIGDRNDDILFRTTDPNFELAEWCRKNGFPLSKAMINAEKRASMESTRVSSGSSVIRYVFGALILALVIYPVYRKFLRKSPKANA